MGAGGKATLSCEQRSTYQVAAVALRRRGQQGLARSWRNPTMPCRWSTRMYRPLAVRFAPFAAIGASRTGLAVGRLSRCGTLVAGVEAAACLVRLHPRQAVEGLVASLAVPSAQPFGSSFGWPLQIPFPYPLRFRQRFRRHWQRLPQASRRIAFAYKCPYCR